MVTDSLCNKLKIKGPGLSSRSRSRACVMKCFYRHFLVNKGTEVGDDYSELRCFLDSDVDYLRCNKEYFEVLFAGVGSCMSELLKSLADCLDRPLVRVTPVEMAVLIIAVFELLYQKSVPAPVVINEAVELAKVYGGTDSYKYVNNTLDRLSSGIEKSIA